MTPRERLTVAVCVCIFVAGGLTAVVMADAVAAQDEESTLDQLTNADEYGYLDGLQGRITGWLSFRIRFLTGEQVTATEACGDLQAAVNADAATIQQWVNNRTTPATDLDTLALTCDIHDESATVYLTANVTNGTYTDAAVVDTTDREPDAACTLSEDAAVNAGDEVETFVDAFADPGEDVTANYQSRLAAQYGGDVSCDGLPGVSG